MSKSYEMAESQVAYVPVQPQYHVQRSSVSTEALLAVFGIVVGVVALTVASIALHDSQSNNIHGQVEQVKTSQNMEAVAQTANMQTAAVLQHPTCSESTSNWAACLHLSTAMNKINHALASNITDAELNKAINNGTFATAMSKAFAFKNGVITAVPKGFEQYLNKADALADTARCTYVHEKSLCLSAVHHVTKDIGALVMWVNHTNVRDMTRQRRDCATIGDCMSEYGQDGETLGSGVGVVGGAIAGLAGKTSGGITGGADAGKSLGGEIGQGLGEIYGAGSYLYSDIESHFGSDSS